MDGEFHGHHAGGAAGRERTYLEQRIERVAAIDRLEGARGLCEEPDRAIADAWRKAPRPRRTLDGDLQAVRQQVAVAARPAIFAVVVNRMIVAAGQLESGEHRL